MKGGPRAAIRGPGGHVANPGVLCYDAPAKPARDLLNAPGFIGIIDARALRRRLEARSMLQRKQTHGHRVASIGAGE